MATIRVTPETLSAQGADLENLAGDIENILASISSKINEIIDGWDGLAQDAYYSMYTTMETSLKQFPELVKTLGTATKSAADSFSQTDEGLAGSFNGAGV